MDKRIPMPRLISLIFTCLLYLTVVAQQWNFNYARNGRDMNCIKIFSPDTVLTAGGWMLADSTQTLYKSYNGGLLWDVYIDINALWLTSVDFTDSRNGIVVGPGSRIMQSNDGGVNWNTISSPVGRDYNRVFFLDAQNGFITGGLKHDSAQAGIQTILKTMNGGSSWNVIHDQPGPWLKSVHFLSPTVGYAVGDSGTILKTTDQGDTWTPIVSPSGRDLNSIWFSDANNGVIVGGHLPDSVRTILHTTNAGNSWAVVKDEPGGWLTDVHFVNPDTGYAVGKSATVLKTIDGGQTWVHVTVGAPGDTYFNAVRFYSHDYGWIVGKWGFEYIYSTTTLPEPYVTGADLIDSTQVIINGVINTNGYPAMYTVIISEDSLLANSGQTFPANVRSNGLSPVETKLGALTPNTTYYYQIKAFSLAGTVYSDTLSFYSGTPVSAVKTLPAGNITSTSAKFNGTVNGFLAQVNLSFEYGNTPAFGSQAPAIPALINDSLLHGVSANVTSLQPNTLYYYRLKGVSGSQTYYGSSYPLYTGSVFTSFTAQDPVGIQDSSATLRGIVSGFKVPATIEFELSTDNVLFAKIPNSQPYLIDDTLVHLINQPSGLLNPSTFYYFRMKATSALGIFYSDTILFNTELANFRTLTLNATQVTASSARLNGRVQHLHLPTTLSFEYGTTPSLGLEVQATPAMVNDTLSHDVSARIGNLQSDRLYYYRIKAEVNNGAKFHGEIKQVYIGTPVIPNWDFQHWSDDTTQLLYRWFMITDDFEKVPGHSGNYAIRIFDQNMISLGKFGNGDAPGGGPAFYEGVPFNARPDSVVVWANYDNLIDSAAGMIVALAKGDSLVGMKFCHFIGSTGGDFARKAYKIDYESPLMPDSLVILILFNQPGHSIILDDISFSPPAPAVINSDFETWFPFSHQSLQDWYYPKFIVFDSTTVDENPMVTRTFFEEPDDYAAEISNIDLDGNGKYFAGNLGSSSGVLGSPKPSFAVSIRHETLNGYFKFYPVNGDTMSVTIVMMKNGSFIGQGVFEYADSVSQFESFNIPILYTDSAVVPDSAIIGISSAKDIVQGPSRLIIDKLSFDGLIGEDTVTGLNPDPGKVLSWNIYPNPAQSHIQIEIQQSNNDLTALSIYDLKGTRFYYTRLDEKMAGDQFVSMVIPLINFPNGLYVVELTHARGAAYKKAVIIR